MQATAECTKRRSIYAVSAFEESDVEVNLMRVYLTEVRVQECVIWIVHFLGFTSRIELFRYAATPAVREAGPVARQVPFRISSGLVA